jgi:hypothetical protein
MGGLANELIALLVIALIIGAICIPGIFRKKSNNETNGSKKDVDEPILTSVNSKDPKSDTRKKGKQMTKKMGD